MVVQILTSMVYEIVRHSWTLMAVAAKYYLAGMLIYLYTENRLGPEELEKKLVGDSRLVVGAGVTAGIVLLVSGVELTPVAKLFSELVALVYLGYLFWEY